MVDLFSLIGFPGTIDLSGDKGSLGGALTIAAFTAALTAAGWLVIKIISLCAHVSGWALGVVRAKKELRAAVVRFYLDVRIRIRSHEQNFSPDVARAYADRIAASPKSFRAYVESTDDNSPNQKMNELLHWMTPEEIPLIRNYIIHDDLFSRQYLRTRSDEFAALSRERKINAINALFATGQNVALIGNELVRVLKKRRFIKRLDAKIDDMLKKLNAGNAPKPPPPPASSREAEIKGAEEEDRTS